MQAITGHAVYFDYDDRDTVYYTVTVTCPTDGQGHLAEDVEFEYDGWHGVAAFSAWCVTCCTRVDAVDSPRRCWDFDVTDEVLLEQYLY
jgi:hypothetical protein